MTEPRYSRVVSLTKEENQRLEEIVKKGFKVIEVFRAGLKAISDSPERRR